MDGRHEYVLSTISERLKMTIEEAEDFIIDGDQVSILVPCVSRGSFYMKFPPSLQLQHFDSFFSPGGRPSLLFFYTPPTVGEDGEKSKSTAYNANGRRLWITDGTQEEYPGVCLFFLRLSPNKPITMANIHQVMDMHKIYRCCY